ncbi:MAG TPA: DnaJ family domain-containing protein [Candidatus Angelobacter sp.]|jgi:hypothetical protein|nr:DnaJ family domain-containing protein [Candidatus Angelobacter sp.]
MPGKPQDLRVNPFVPADERMAYDILHAQGFAPPWIEERRDLLRDRESLLRALHTSWQRHAALPTAAERNRDRARWGAAAAAFRRDAAGLNQRIRSHNRLARFPGMRVPVIDADEALRGLRGA